MPFLITQDAQAVDINNPSSYSMGLVLYYMVFLFPIFVCVFAYAILIIVVSATSFLRVWLRVQLGERSCSSFWVGISTYFHGHRRLT